MNSSYSFSNDPFRKVSKTLWNNWHWQLDNRLRTPADFHHLLALTQDETKTMTDTKAFPTAVTPYYARIVAQSAEIRRSVLPSSLEKITSIGETLDPLGEEPCMVAPNLVHRYPDRVLFLATDHCSTYCRYCTRSRIVGGKKKLASQNWQLAFDYIKEHKQIRDVLISGGDPLTLQDEVLDFLVSEIRKIPHVDIIRIGSKVPVVLPMRITGALMKMFKKYAPIFFSLHFTHADEITPECALACNRIADAGIVMGSQTVLLKGINDTTNAVKNLMHALLKIRVRPYYLLQCDPIAGSAHFRVPISKGLEIIKDLRGNTSGYAVPTYAVDIPQGGGKVVLSPEQYVGRDGDFVLFNNFENKVYRYPDPISIPLKPVL